MHFMENFVTSFEYTKGQVKLGVNKFVNERVQIIDPEDPNPVPFVIPDYVSKKQPEPEKETEEASSET